jgi:hypothetical protein
MRPLFVLLCMLCFAQVSAAQQELISVPFVDETDTGSPIAVIGQISLRETIAANQVASSWGERVVAKNISTKPILLFVASLAELGRHGRGAFRGPGDGPTYILNDDRFFTKTVIQPGESLVLRDTTPDTAQVECCVNPLTRGSDPKAAFRVCFVQFADGSSFGDPAEGKDALEIRRVILNGLRKLVQSYSDHGQAGLLTEMDQRSPWSATLPFAEIRASYEQNGAAAAIARAQQILAIAENHEASIRRAEIR